MPEAKDFIDIRMLLTDKELLLLRNLLNDKLSSCLQIIDHFDPSEDRSLIDHIMITVKRCDNILEQLPYPDHLNGGLVW